MPSEIKTENLGLNKWEGNEYPKRTDFVNDNEIIDEAIGKLDSLKTENKSNIVAAVNEVREQNDNLETNKADLVDGKVPEEQLPEMNYLSPTGDGKDVTVTFTESGSRININTTEKLSVLFGKIKKYFTDLKTVAFTGSYTDLSNKPTSLPADGGNADTATKLQTARNINGVTFDGTQNITIVDSTKAPTSHASSASTYGLGTESNYGHVRVYENLTTAAGNGRALGVGQGKVLKDLIDNYNPIAYHVSGSTPADNVVFAIGSINANLGYRVLCAFNEGWTALYLIDPKAGILNGIHVRDRDRVYAIQRTLTTTDQIISGESSSSASYISARKSGDTIYFSARGSTQGIGSYVLDVI